MNELITRVTSSGFRKYVYRLAWAGLCVAIAYGKLDATQLEVLMGLVAAVLAIADSQTTSESGVVAASTARLWADTAYVEGHQDAIDGRVDFTNVLADEAETAIAWKPLSEIPEDEIVPREDD